MNFPEKCKKCGEELSKYKFMGLKSIEDRKAECTILLECQKCFHKMFINCQINPRRVLREE